MKKVSSSSSISFSIATQGDRRAFFNVTISVGLSPVPVERTEISLERIILHSTRILDRHISDMLYVQAIS